MLPGLVNILRSIFISLPSIYMFVAGNNFVRLVFHSLTGPVRRNLDPKSRMAICHLRIYQWPRLWRVFPVTLCTIRLHHCSAGRLASAQRLQIALTRHCAQPGAILGWNWSLVFILDLVQSSDKIFDKIAGVWNDPGTSTVCFRLGQAPSPARCSTVVPLTRHVSGKHFT